MDEVVEVEVEVEEMEQGRGKEGVEAKVVVETAGGGGGMSQRLRTMMVSRDAGAIHDLPWDPAVLDGLHPPNQGHPLFVATESPVWTLRFLFVRVHHRRLGAGRWVSVDEGGVVRLDRPLRLGVVNAWWGWQPELPGPRKGWGEVSPPPPPEKGVNTFQLAQTNIFNLERKKGGGTHWRFFANCWQGVGLGGVGYVGKAWTWTPTWSALMDFGGFNPEAANRGAYAGLVHDIASRPKTKPKPAALGAPCNRTPATPGTPSPRPRGPSPPP